MLFYATEKNLWCGFQSALPAFDIHMQAHRDKYIDTQGTHLALSNDLVVWDVKCQL